MYIVFQSWVVCLLAVGLYDLTSRTKHREAAKLDPYRHEVLKQRAREGMRKLRAKRKEKALQLFRFRSNSDTS
jgi:hypothetical protein